LFYAYSAFPAMGMYKKYVLLLPASTEIGIRVGWLTLPIGSVATTVIVCEPFASGVLGVQLQLPLMSAVAVQMVVPPSVTMMVLPGSAVPVKVGVVEVVAPATGPMTTGAVGAVASTVIATVAGVLVVPAGLVAVAMMV
jgi:hypothetical protein